MCAPFCQADFAAMPGELSWDVPDLHVILRDDVSITRAPNHMHADTPDGATIDSWSRGTRVFQRQAGGTWLMTHQHVSYPYHPATGAARTDQQR